MPEASAQQCQFVATADDAAHQRPSAFQECAPSFCEFATQLQDPRRADSEDSSYFIWYPDWSN